MTADTTFSTQKLDHLNLKQFIVRHFGSETLFKNHISVETKKRILPANKCFRGLIFF
jgi:hypothetical protein